MAEHGAQGIGIEPRVPGPVRLIVLAQHADQAIGQIAHLRGMRGFIGPRRSAGCADVDMREIGSVARPVFRLGNVQRERGTIAV